MTRPNEEIYNYFYDFKREPISSILFLYARHMLSNTYVLAFILFCKLRFYLFTRTTQMGRKELIYEDDFYIHRLLIDHQTIYFTEIP